MSTEHLGSTRVCTDAGGGSPGSCHYEPFGENQPGTSCSLPTRFRFAGMDFDSDTALYHTWFREYDPNQGRWMAVDPLPGSEVDPQSRDRYAYVLNDPVNFLDPLGLDCAFWVLMFDPSTERSWWEGFFCGGTAARATSTNCDKTKAGCAPGGGSAGSGNPQPPQPLPQPEPPPPCIPRESLNFAQRATASALSFWARVSNSTLGLGAGGSAAIGAGVHNVRVGPGGSVSSLIVSDPAGNSGVLLSYSIINISAVRGSGAAIGGAQVLVSSSPAPSLSGPAFSVGGAYGAGAAVGLDYTPGSNTAIVTLGIGVGARVGVGGVASDSIFIPFCSRP